MGRKWKYLVFKLDNDGSSYIIDKKGEPSSTFENFKNDVPKNEPRYLVYDLDIVTYDGRKENKIIFILYSPDNSNVKHKFTYSTGKERLKSAIGAVNKEF